MRKTRIIVRLYRAHDLDIITFVRIHRLDLQKAMYCALKAFSRGEHFIIDIPPLRDSLGEQIEKRVYSTILYLDPEKDGDIIQVLLKIKEGYRNNFIKNLLRLYLCNPMAETFLNDESDSEFFTGKFKMFKEGRRITDAASEVKERKTGKAAGKEAKPVYDNGDKPGKEKNAEKGERETAVKETDKEELRDGHADRVMPEDENEGSGGNTGNTESTGSNDSEKEIMDILSSLL